MDGGGGGGGGGGGHRKPIWALCYPCSPTHWQVVKCKGVGGGAAGEAMASPLFVSLESMSRIM